MPVCVIGCLFKKSHIGSFFWSEEKLFVAAMPEINSWNIVKLLYDKYKKPPHNKNSVPNDEEKELFNIIDGK